MTLQFFALGLFCWALFFTFKKTKGKQMAICLMLIVAGIFLPYTPFGTEIRSTLESVFSTASSTVNNIGSSR
jgi:glucan phosphoethanolaminetransferase (alkaline phosphatase superfamily)